jgi:hypothetical protein
MTRRNNLTGVAVGLAAGGIFFLGAVRSPILGVGVLLGIFGFLLVLRYPGVGMALLTFLIPLERMQRFTDDTATFSISLMRILALMCLAGILVHRISEKRSLRLDPSMFLYSGYVLLAMLALFYSTDLEGTKRAVGNILANCMLFVLFINYFEKTTQIRLAIWIWLAANLAGAIYSTYDWHFGSGRSGGVQTEFDPGEGAQLAQNRWATVWEDRAEWESLGGLSLRRSMGPTSHAAVYGINLIMTIPFFFYLLKRHRKLWQKAALVLGLGIIGYNILLTNTRAVILMALIICLLCLIFGLFTIRTYQVLAGLIGLAIMLPVLPKDLYNRVLNPENYSANNSGAMRVRFFYWEAASRILEDHFLFGVGVGNEKVVPQYVKSGFAADQTSVHNIFLQVAIEVGIIGWLLFFSFVGMMFYYARKAAQWFQRRAGGEDEGQILVCIQVGMLAVLLFGLQVDVFNFPLKGWWLMAAIAVVLYRRSVAARRKVESVSASQSRAIKECLA